MVTCNSHVDSQESLKCGMLIREAGITFKCNKKVHEDVYWHQSKSVHSSQPNNIKGQHRFIMLVATWRNERSG